METGLKIRRDNVLVNNGKLQITKPQDTEIEILNFDTSSNKSIYVLALKSELFTRDNFTLAVHENTLFLIISEIRENNRPYHFHNLSLHTLANGPYERLRSVDITLPRSNYLLIRIF